VSVALNGLLPGKNVLLHPSFHRTGAQFDGKFVYRIALQNKFQVAESFGIDVARVVVEDLLTRVRGLVASAGEAAIVNGNQIHAVIWDEAFFGDKKFDECQDVWVEGLFRNLTLEPFETQFGPVHLRVGFAEHGAAEGRTADTEGFALELVGAGASSDPEDARRLYRSDMAALSPVLCSLGGFQRIGRENLNVDVCWQPVRGVVSSGPHAFFEASLATFNSAGQVLCTSRAIEAAKRLGFIDVIDRYLVSRVIDELINARGAVNLSVSVSGENLKIDRFWCGVFERLKRSAAAARGLIVEIRGDACPEKSPGMWQVLSQLKQLGCRISVGNFGVSATSMRFLVAFSPDIATVDRHFLTAAAQARSGTAALSHLVGLARALGSEVVLDGVDTADNASIAVEVGASLQKGSWCGAPRLFRPWAVGLSR
jgi:EAL domain-containing protein (putative c-di-GMP-specific phosphodiesterase class I)